MYEVLVQSPSAVFPFQTIWNPVVPPKFGFFAWEALRGKVLTLDQLKRRGMALADRYFLCKEDELTVEHLLVHYPGAKLLWELVLAIVGLS